MGALGELSVELTAKARGMEGGKPVRSAGPARGFLLGALALALAACAAWSSAGAIPRSAIRELEQLPENKAQQNADVTTTTAAPLVWTDTVGSAAMNATMIACADMLNTPPLWGWVVHLSDSDWFFCPRWDWLPDFLSFFKGKGGLYQLVIFKNMTEMPEAILELASKKAYWDTKTFDGDQCLLQLSPNITKALEDDNTRTDATGNIVDRTNKFGDTEKGALFEYLNKTMKENAWDCTYLKDQKKTVDTVCLAFKKQFVRWSTIVGVGLAVMFVLCIPCLLACSFRKRLCYDWYHKRQWNIDNQHMGLDIDGDYPMKHNEHAKIVIQEMTQSERAFFEGGGKKVKKTKESAEDQGEQETQEEREEESVEKQKDATEESADKKNKKEKKEKKKKVKKEKVEEESA